MSKFTNEEEAIITKLGIKTSSYGHYSASFIHKIKDGSIVRSGYYAANVDVDDGSYESKDYSDIIAHSFEEWIKPYFHQKIIFLDIDGVLNVHFSKTDRFGRLFHPQFINNLKRIIEETDAKIVISSSWKDSGLREIKYMWEYRQLPGEVIYVTPIIKRSKGDEFLTFKERSERGNEIQMWLDKHPTISYVIIDDDDDMLEDQMEFFVQTSGNSDHIDCEDIGYGLTSICADKVIEILNNKK